MNLLLKSFCGAVPRPPAGWIVRMGDAAVVVRPDAELPPGFPDIPTPEDVRKDSRSVAAFRCGGGLFFAKVYKFRGLAHGLAHACRTPRAFTCFAAAEALKNAGFATPEAVAAAVHYRFGIPTRQILLTEALPEDTVFLDRELAAATPDAARTLLRELAAFAAKLHQAGFLHGDLSLRNLYRVPGDRKFGLIDLDGLLLARANFSRFAAAGELARILSSSFRVSPDLPDREDCVREVLKSYRESGGTNFRPDELLPIIRRQEKHRPHASVRH